MSTSLIINISIIVVSVAAGFLAALALNRYKQVLARSIQSAGAIGSDSTDDNEASSKESFWFGLSYSGLALLAAILIPLGLWFGLHGARKWFGEIGETMTDAPVMLTLVVIAGVVGLLAVLMMAALAFSAVKLADKTQALGLPEGSVRAVIALSLIVIFVITVVFLFEKLASQLSQVQHLTLEQTNAIPGNLIVAKHPEDELKAKEAANLKKKADDLKPQNSPEAIKAQEAAAKAANEAEAAKGLYTVERYFEPNHGSEDFAKQVITTISTLVVSISAFYFGSSTAISAQKSAQASSTTPVITKQPADVSVAAGQPAEFNVVATGSNLSYQWQKVADSAAADIPGATTNTYRIDKAATTDNGSKFSCKISNPAGTVTSTAAKLTVT